MPAACAAEIGRGNQPLRDAALSEHLGSKGVNGEHNDEERHAAVGEERTHQHDDDRL